jgi:hypothetical protein
MAKTQGIDGGKRIKSKHAEGGSEAKTGWEELLTCGGP